ncbi:MAG TPA: ABC transporter ATP-binding protein [Kiritimatiellia bacterium]|nr:ABC transporter ATP-binding protein [Kiritimatiellia bacterium]
MSEPAISIRNLSKCYRLGTIGRHTLVDEAQYWWHKIRGKDPREHFAKVGHGATDRRRVEAEKEGNPEFWALKDVSFDVQPGEVIGIIGRNGAGKSTLLKILTRITEPTSGEAVIDGRVASLLEVGTGFHPELTGRENVFMNGTILGMKSREIAAKFDEVVAFSEMEKFIDTPVKRYSSGMYVRLAFAVAAHLDPEILLIDEVLAVGDASFQKKCIGKMGDVAKGGRTILFVSHNMAAVENLCSRAVWLENGGIRMIGDSAPVVDQYLGVLQGAGKTVALQDRADRQGSGRARILDFYITDMEGRRKAVLSPGKKYCFHLICRIMTADRQLSNVSAAIALHDHKNDMIWLVNSNFTNENQTLAEGNNDIVCHIVDFNVAEGIYSASVSIGQGSIEALDSIYNAAEVDVQGGDYFGTGAKGTPAACKILTRAHWELSR